MGNFKRTDTPIEGLCVIEPRRFGDARGFFVESYVKRDFEALGIGREFVQDNHSRSARGVLRGLHFQRRQVQAKLVRVVRGAVLDVAVDLRRGSPSFGKWHAELLSAENGRMFYLPEGFAHGFLSLEDDSELLYKCSDYYAPQFDGGVMWNDPAIGVDWRLKEFGFTPEELIFSEKDLHHPTLESKGFLTSGLPETQYAK